MPDVFISYSRRNLEFVQQLVAALKKSGKDPWFDQLKEPLSGISAGAPWWKEIQYGIENVDNFLFVVSPNSIKSPYCHAEIHYAHEHGKRLVPILYCGWIGESETRTAIDAAIEAIPDTDEIPNSVTSSILNLKKLVRENWLTISEIQYVIFASSVAFEQSLEQLIQALDLDLAWVRMHSQLVQAAKLWEANNRSDGYLWSAERLKPVYKMMERRKPALDVLVQSFIEPEQERLLHELIALHTSHRRRFDIGDRLSVIGDPRSGIGLTADGIPQIDWLPVTPGGTITIEKQRFSVEPFYIAKYLVTYAQFQAFAGDPKVYNLDRWWDWMPDQYRRQALDIPPSQQHNYPRSSVSWYQAMAFTRWLNDQYREKGLLPVPLLSVAEQTGVMRRLLDNKQNMEKGVWGIRLPTEWEWQWAAQNGQEVQAYPWGAWDDQPRANTTEAGINNRSTAVGMYPDGAAACGALDMAGNLWEWCLNDHEDIKRISRDNGKNKVLRGGSFNGTQDLAAASFRIFYSLPGDRSSYYGFRVVLGSLIQAI